MKTWYLVLIKPGKGKALKAKEKLESIGVITLYPLLHRKQLRKERNKTIIDISQPIFTGYIF
ncbi:transcription termination/antitermination NusG family protein, partial [Salmonella enterica subsp. enterica serovar Infantis]